MKYSLNSTFLTKIKKNHRHSIVLFWSILLCLTIGNTLFAKPKTIPLKWPAVSGASAYQLQIRNKNGEIILEQKVRTNAIQTQLNYGEYEIRIGIINIFDKIIGWTPWKRFSIKQPMTPKIQSLSQTRFYQKQKNAVFTIYGENFNSRTEVFAIIEDKANSDIKQTKLSAKFISDKKIQVHFHPQNFPLSTLGIRILNPLQKFALLENAITIEKARHSSQTQTPFHPTFSVELEPFLSVLAYPKIFQPDIGGNIGFHWLHSKIWLFHPGIRYGYYQKKEQSFMDLHLSGHIGFGTIQYTHQIVSFMDASTTIGIGFNQSTMRMKRTNKIFSINNETILTETIRDYQNAAFFADVKLIFPLWNRQWNRLWLQIGAEYMVLVANSTDSGLIHSGHLKTGLQINF